MSLYAAILLLPIEISIAHDHTHVHVVFHRVQVNFLISKGLTWSNMIAHLMLMTSGIDKSTLLGDSVQKWAQVIHTYLYIYIYIHIYIESFTLHIWTSNVRYYL